MQEIGRSLKVSLNPQKSVSERLTLDNLACSARSEDTMTVISAFQFLAPGKVRLIETAMPEPGPEQLAIRMLATSMCNHSELRSFHGGEPSGYGSHYPMLPGEPGHEGVGEVTAVGASVTDFVIGDLVVLTGWGGDPAHRSHLLRRASAVAKIEPDGRDPKPASILEMFGCAYHCVRVGWQRQEGFDQARVAVIGAGAIGLCSIQILRLWPVKSVVALEVNATKLALAGKLGATETILVPGDSDAEVFANKLERFDIVVECSGHVSGQILAHALAPRLLINVSYCPKPFAVNQGKWFDATTTVYNPGIVTDNELRAVANLYNRRLLDPAPMVSKIIPPDPQLYLETIQAIQRGEIVKALIDWEAL